MIGTLFLVRTRFPIADDPTWYITKEPFLSSDPANSSNAIRALPLALANLSKATRPLLLDYATLSNVMISLSLAPANSSSAMVIV